MSHSPNELEQALIGDSYAAPPSHIIEGLSEEIAHQLIPSTPRTIYSELWHIAFWQQMSLDWMRSIETPYPANTSIPFPTIEQTSQETWDQLRTRFLRTSEEAAAVARNIASLDKPIRCTSRPGEPVRTMSVRDQLISLAAHNAYHFGRLVIMRQILGSWPPPSGGFTW
jgi:uncharacterized damage-inducible protein DinB